MEFLGSEFGCVSDTPPMNDLMWFCDIISLFHENGFHWTLYNYMSRTSDSYWKNHFDCNLYLFYTPTAKLNAYTKKINLIKFFVQAKGEVLDITQLEDEDIGCYTVKQDNGKITVLLWNKNSNESKSIELRFVNLSAIVKIALMDSKSENFIARPDLSILQNILKIKLPSLSIVEVFISSSKVLFQFQKNVEGKKRAKIY